MLNYIIIAVIAYLLGSISFGMIVAKLKGGPNLREVGSKNTGATNVLRVMGVKTGLIVFVLDILKALVACIIGRCWMGLNGAMVAGLAVVAGHNWPCFFQFKGGKGVVAITAMCFFTDWRVFLIMFVIYAVVIAGYKMVSLASCMVAALYPLVLYPFIGPSLGIIFAFLSSAFVIYFHRENIKRIYHHTESKLNFSKKSKKNEAADTENDGE